MLLFVFIISIRSTSLIKSLTAVNWFQGDGEDEELVERKHVDVGTRKIHEPTIPYAGACIYPVKQKLVSTV